MMFLQISMSRNSSCMAINLYRNPETQNLNDTRAFKPIITSNIHKAVLDLHHPRYQRTRSRKVELTLTQCDRIAATTSGHGLMTCGWPT